MHTILLKMRIREAVIVVFCLGEDNYIMISFLYMQLTVAKMPSGLKDKTSGENWHKFVFYKSLVSEHQKYTNSRSSPLYSAAFIRSSWAVVCYAGHILDPSLNSTRWVLPVADPCRCTAVRPGGMLVPAGPLALFASVDRDKPVIFSEAADEIRAFFNCPGKHCGSSPLPLQPTGTWASGKGLSGVESGFPKGEGA